MKLPGMAWASLMISVELQPKLLSCFPPAFCLHVALTAEQAVLVAWLSPQILPVGSVWGLAPHPWCWLSASDRQHLICLRHSPRGTTLPRVCWGCAQEGPHWECADPGREKVLGTAGSAGLREEPQLLCLGQLSPPGRMVALVLLHWARMEKFASISLSGKGKRKIPVPEKRKELYGFYKVMADCFQFFFIPNDLRMTYFKRVANTDMLWEALYWGTNEKWLFSLWILPLET